MFSIVADLIKLVTFDERYYEKLVKNIEESNCYACYINSKMNTGVVNREYQQYLLEKQEMYTYYTNTNITDDLIYQMLITPSLEECEMFDKIDKTTVEALYDKYGISDDYIINILEEIEVNGARLRLKQALPFEKKWCDLILQVDNNLESINRSQLSELFIYNDYRRFIFPAILIKNSEGDYELAFLILTVYNTGIITYQLIVTFNASGGIKIKDEFPRDKELLEVDLIKIKKHYEKTDFWLKDKKYNMTLNSLLEYYENLVCTIINKQKRSIIEMKSSRKNTALFWTLGDFNFKKTSSQIKQSQDIQSTINYYLLNTKKSSIDGMTKENLQDNLKKTLILNLKHLSFYCGTYNAVLYMDKNSIYMDFIKEDLKENEQLLKQLNLYERTLQEHCKESMIVNMFDFIRFYELAFIKKHYIRTILDDISLNQYQTLLDYKIVKQKFNFLNMKFDEEFLFHSEGSAREIYRKILEKTESNLLQSKAEYFITSISDDITQERNSRIQKNDNNMIIVSSVLTAIVSYDVIKNITVDVLCNLNIPIIDRLINKHPLRTAIILWGGLILIMIIFNLKRIKIHREKSKSL